MIFCYEKYLILICYDEACLNILISLCIILSNFDTTCYLFSYQTGIRDMIYEKFWFKNDMNWQPDYVKDSVNGGIYVGNWFILRVYITSEIRDKPPARPAVLKDFTVRWFAAHRKMICGVMTLPQKKYDHSS